MTIAVRQRLEAVERFARLRLVRNELRDRANQPITAYALRLVSWVIQGTEPPKASPTDEIRRLVRSAVDRALLEYYGDDNSPTIPEGVRLRRNSLWRDPR